MNTFAYIIPPEAIKRLNGLLQLGTIIPGPFLNPFIKIFKTYKLKNIRSAKAKEIEGYFIIAGGLSEESLLPALEIAARLGAGITGLHECASFRLPEDCLLSGKIKMPLTNGASLTSWAVFEAIYRAFCRKKDTLKQSTLAIIGANSANGYLCAKKLSGCLNKIILVGKEKEKLALLKQNITGINPIEVNIEEDIPSAIKEADILINLNGSANILFNNLEGLKEHTVIFDLSTQRENKGRLPRDISIIKAGLIKTPAGDIIPAGLAETMLLTLESKFTSYSLGENINPDNMEEIADIAAKHDFEVWVPEAPVL